MSVDQHWRVKEMTGLVFSRLTVICQVNSPDKNKNRSKYWKCLCQCGNTKTFNGGSLRSGLSKSCGCYQREIAKKVGDRTRTHGMSKKSIYAIWDSMVQRCYNPKRRDYKTYGAKGISVCLQWRSNFVNFFEDMGHRPTGMTLDRKDPSLGYSPENCRWATTREQAHNRTDNRLMTLDGETKCLQAWADQVNINKVTLQSRLRRGWDDGKALTTPVETRYSHDKNTGRKKQGSPNAQML